MSHFLRFIGSAIFLIPFLFFALSAEVVKSQESPTPSIPGVTPSPTPLLSIPGVTPSPTPLLSIPGLIPSPTPPLNPERPNLDDLIRSRRPNQSTDLRGTLTDKNGAVISGAIITAVNKDTRQQFPPVTTGPDGGFTVPDLPPGVYEIVVSAPNFEPRQVTATVNVGQTSSLSINLDDTQPVHGSVATHPPQPGKLSGTVVDANSGRAIRGAEVTIIETNFPFRSFVLSTNGRGKFTKSRLSPEKYKVTVKASGFADQEQVVELAERENKALSFRLTP